MNLIRISGLVVLILIGQNFVSAEENSPFPEASNPQEKESNIEGDKPRNKLRARKPFSIYALYNMAESMTAEKIEVTIGTTSAKGSSKGEFDKGLGIGLAYDFSTSNDSIKFNVSFEYEMPKPIKSISYSINGTTTTSSLATAKMASYQIGGSVVKNWNNRSIFGGLNFTRPIISGVSGEKIGTVMGTGFHAGYGYDLDEMMSVEILIKRAGFQIYETADDNSFYINHSNIYSDGLQLQARFRF